MTGSPSDEALLQQLWRLTKDARWFSGKSRQARPSAVEIGSWIIPPTGGLGVRSATLHVNYSNGESERFHVPLAVDQAASPAESSDATTNPLAAVQLLQALADEAPGFVRYLPTPSDLPARLFGGEQSNTTIFFGEKLLCKVFRRLEHGPNVDLELHQALQGSGVVADLYGYWHDGDTVLGIFLEAFTDPIDGYVAACRSAKSGTSFSEHATALGRGLAKVHETLAERLPTDHIDATSLGGELRRRFEAAADEVPQLGAFRQPFHEATTALGDGEFATQRIHGDCHLGQVLLTDGEWRYVDFEGEPLKTLEERRRPDTVARDIAGMLRSFAYAAATTLDGARDWLQECRVAFLRGYGQNYPKAVLRALELDKAFYEVIYETRNRPNLVRVPLDFLNKELTKEPNNGA